MKLFNCWWVLVVALVSGCASIPHAMTAAARKELAPTGTLRVGIVIAPVAANPFFATKDPATDQPRGVTVDLGAELAQKVGVPLELVAYAAAAALLKDATSGAWDVTFLPVDSEREKVVDFGPAYFVTESTYLVPAASTIRSIADVDRPGVRVAARTKSTQAVHLSKSLKNATLLLPGTVEEQLEMLRSSKADAIASARPVLVSLAPDLPGARVLDGSFASTSIAVAVPKNRPAALAYVSEFIETAKTTGIVRRAFDNAGVKDVMVAPAAGR